MANEQNLIKNDDLTPSERRENARKAGIASGKARREKKAMKDTLEVLLSMPLKSGKSTDLESIKNIAAVKGKNITVQEAIMLAQIQKAMKGDTRAAEFIRDSSGNMMNAESEARINKIKAETARIKGEDNGNDNDQVLEFIMAMRGQKDDSA